MARQVPWGTPSKSSRHLFPDTSRRLLYVSLGAGGILIAAIAALFALGDRGVVSPGDVAAAHSHIDAKCTLCHDEGRSMALEGSEGKDVRCARCHDPSGVGRLTNASHVLLGSGDPQKASQASGLPCTQCHVDHRGTQFSLRSVDDRQCAQCHRGDFTGVLTIAPLTSFSRHPEFAAFKAKRSTGVGLLFNHVTHFDYVLRERRGVKDVSAEDAQKGAADTCDRCHSTTRDRREFVPVSFETGCAGSVCHTDRNGVLNEGTRDVTVAHIAQLVPGAAAPTGEGDDQVRVYTGFQHRDEWLQANAAWLRTSLDPAGAAADRAALRSSLTWLEQQETMAPWQAATVEDLTRWQTRLTQEIADLDTRIAGVGQTTDELKSLAQDAAAIQKLLTQAGGGSAGDPQVDADVARLSAGNTTQDDNPAQLFESRRREVSALLAAVRSRAQAAGDNALLDKVAALESRANQLKPSPSQTAADLALLRTQLAGLDEVTRAVRQTNDAQALQDLASLQALRDFAAGSGLGGVPAAQFEQRRQEVLRLLDTVGQLGRVDLQQKIADLRSRVASLEPNSGNLEDLQSRREDRRRILGRVLLELELADSPDRATALPAPVRDDAARRLAADMREALEWLDLASTAPPAADADRAARQQTVSALLAPCLKCHLFDGEDENHVYPLSGGAGGTRSTLDVLSRAGLRIARVSAAEPVMKRAVFTHGPHLVATNCANCHTSINGSMLAIDFNSPGVATCQTCHTSSGARSTCAACHIYHPPSGGRLLRSVWSAN
jgi:hypothetical protein